MGGKKLGQARINVEGILRNDMNTFTPSEREIQRRTVAALRKAGFTVWVTSGNRTAQNTAGTPDLFVGIGGGMCVALEMKAPKGKLTAEQERLHAEGKIIVVRSVEEAIDAVIDRRSVN